MDPNNNNLTDNNPNPTPVTGPTPDPAIPDPATPVTPTPTPINTPETPQEPLSGPVDLSSLDSQFGAEPAPEAPEVPPAPETPPEPIVPSEPLPGSIGSVTSGAPVPTDGVPATPVTPEPTPAPEFTPEPTPVPAPAPEPPVPEAPSFAPVDQPAQPNPFDQPQPAMEQPPSVSTAPVGPAPAQNKPRSKVIIILLIVLGVLVLALAGFAIFQALSGSNNDDHNQSNNNTTEVTPAPEPEKTILACTLDGDEETLASMGESVTAFNQQYTIDYEDDELADISTISTITYNSADTASGSIAALKESYENYYKDTLKLTVDPFKSTFVADKDEPTKVIVTHFATNDALTANTSKFFNLNSTSIEGGYLTSQSDIKKLYEGMGLTCTSRNAQSGTEVEEEETTSSSTNSTDTTGTTGTSSTGTVELND